MSSAEVSETLKISGRHLSVDAPFAQGEDNRLLDVLQDPQQLPPDMILMNDSLRVEVKRALLTLSTREREVLELFYGLDDQPPMALEEIGDRFKLTRERVRQIKEKAIRRLRHAHKTKPLRNFLG